MNQKTVKFLRQYASHSGSNIKELKTWWKGLSWTEKTAERKRMADEMGADAPVEEAEATEAAE